MKGKTSPRDIILMIAAMSGGEAKKDLCKEICGDKNYRVVMETMRKNKEAETVFGNTPRTLQIKKEGVERIKNEVPWIEDLYQRRLLAYHKDRSMRRADISQVIYNMYISGIEFQPKGKKKLYEGKKIKPDSRTAYYCPAEMKAEYADGLQGSRSCGYIRGDKKGYLLYNMESRNIKFIKKIETRAKTYMDACTNQDTGRVLYGNGFMMVNTILDNLAYLDKMRKTAGEINLVTPDMDMYFIPNGKAGSVYLKSLFHQDVIEEIRKKLREQEKKEVVSLIPAYLPSCKRLIEEKGRVIVLCLCGQRELFECLAKGATGNLEVRMLEESYLEKFFYKLEQGTQIVPK